MMNQARNTTTKLLKRVPSSRSVLPATTRYFHQPTPSPFLAPHDSTPIDYYFLPRPPPPTPRREWISIPYLPSTTTPSRPPSHIITQASDPDVIRPEIYTAAMAAGEAGPASAMTDVTDNAAMKIDPYELTEVVRDAAGEAARKLDGMQKAVGQEGGALREFWKGVVDDVLGEKEPKTS